jgi:hypothetical protein
MDHRLERLTPNWVKFFLRRVKPGEVLSCNHRTCPEPPAWVWSFSNLRAGKALRRSLLCCEAHGAEVAERENIPMPLKPGSDA